jgi:AcrR family transcriptional regulator
MTGISDTPVQRILAAATADIVTFGPDRTTVVSIARSAGMTHANIYRHFEDKDALFDAVTLLWLKPLETRLGEIADAPDPAHDKLERLIFGLVSAYRDRIEQESRLFDLFVAAFAESRPLARQHRARVRILFDRVLEEGQSAGAFAFKSREKALTLILDALYRFLNPEPIRSDREMTRKTWESRLSAVIATILAMLGAGRL